MPFVVGDIIIKKGIVFKDSDLYDSHENGRPILIIHTTEDSLYYLVMSSSVGVHDNSPQFFPLDYRVAPNDRFNHSSISLKYIYKDVYDEKPVIAKMPINYLGKILEKLIDYQENVGKDVLYDEISESLKRTKERCEVEYDETDYWNHRKKR